MGRLLSRKAARLADAEDVVRPILEAVRKGGDLLLANDVAEAGSGFGTDTNHVTLVVPGGDDEEWPLMSKRQVADRLWDRVIATRATRSKSGAQLAAT